MNPKTRMQLALITAVALAAAAPVALYFGYWREAALCVVMAIGSVVTWSRWRTVAGRIDRVD